MSITDSSLQTVSQEVADREARITFQDVKLLSRSAGLQAAIDTRTILLSSGCHVIATFDREATNWSDHASPAEFARQAEALGVGMLSCKVRRGRFQIAAEDLKNMRLATSLPVLFDDLIIDPYQIHEARVLGADVLPLSAWAMDQPKLESLIDRIESLGMTAFVEVRNPDEAQRAAAAGCFAVVVNLFAEQGLYSSMENFERICLALPEQVVRVVLGNTYMTPNDVFDFAEKSADAVYLEHATLQSTRTLVTAGLHPACPSRAV